jgi:hypothetical protein
MDELKKDIKRFSRQENINKKRIKFDKKRLKEDEIVRKI